MEGSIRFWIDEAGFFCTERYNCIFHGQLN